MKLRALLSENSSLEQLTLISKNLGAFLDNYSPKEFIDFIGNIDLNSYLKSNKLDTERIVKEFLNKRKK